jgi:HSP20 family protein
MFMEKNHSLISEKGTFTTPPVDLLEAPGHFLLLMDLPGVPQEGVEIKVRDGMLRITGTPKRTQSKRDRLLYGEFKHGTFQRKFRLSEDVVDIDKATAHLENGVLSMILPKRERKQARRIPVRRRP